MGGGVATTREAERALAPTGLLVEAMPLFEAAESVAKAGVLVALPALLGQGLVEVGQTLYGRLKNGYYGLTSMLLSFGLMALVRITSTEGLTTHAPGEFGRVLGLDRAPEMKTARRKLAELAGRGRALEFSRAFAERWATEAPDALGYLYIDGHVRPYHGRTLTLPKTHVPRRRLCMPATTDYWVNDAHAEPLLFITAPANEGLLAMMTQELLPQIRTLAGDDRRVTLIFDREGWSPTTFRTWMQAGFDVITYRKGRYRDWQRRCFTAVTVDVSGRPVTYLLAERMVRVAPGFRMREVRRLCETGHQTSVVTTRRDLPIETVARRMFSRWQQENFFRYMRQEFAVDHLPTTAVEPADPERRVPNPAVTKTQRERGRVMGQLAKAEQAYGQQAHDHAEQTRRAGRGVTTSQAEQRREITQLRAACEQLDAAITALPRARPRAGHHARGAGHPAGARAEDHHRHRENGGVPRGNAAGKPVWARCYPTATPKARKFMRQVFALPADLLPDYERGELRVRLHSLTTPRDNRVLASLCAVLNELDVYYPDTELKLVLEATQATTE